MKDKLWLARAVRGGVKKDAERIRIADAGSDQNGETFYEISDMDNGRPSLTSSKWAALAMLLTDAEAVRGLPDAPKGDDDEP